METGETMNFMMKYISIWFWNVLSLIFLSSSLIVFALEDNIRTNVKAQVIFLVLFFLFIITQAFMIRRRNQLMNDGGTKE